MARYRTDPARRIAWQALRAVQADDAYANLVLPPLIRQARLDARDAAFATELAYGTLRGQGTYDAVLAACSDRPLAEIDPPVLDALRLGTHQLLGMRVPAHAAVAATVDLVRGEIGQGAAGFANAVLRRVAERDRADWIAALTEGRPADDALALRYAHPAWIVRALRDALRHHGRDVAELPDLLAADNDPPPVTLAALPGLSRPEDLPHTAPGRGLSPYAVVVHGDPGALPAVRSGAARVQDEGSQVVALALADAALGVPGGEPAEEPSPKFAMESAAREAISAAADGGAWLDLCAGPGGKSALLGAVLLERRRRGELPPSAQLLATEIAPHRAALVTTSVAGVNRAARQTAQDAVRVVTADGRELADLLGEDAREHFDRVLLDAPCTGLGALRRRPESRWRRRPADLAALAPLQRALLRAALDAVRPGGVVAYVTCSPHPAETTLVVDDVLRRDGYERVAERAAPDRQLWPHVDGTDAMYLALLRRVRSNGP